MVNSRISRRSSEKTLFVWDGTSEFIAGAERIIAASGCRNIIAVYAMPHESVYSYSTVLDDNSRFESTVSRLRDQFEATVDSSVHLRRARFDLLLGDRIREIVRYAQALRIDTVLLPRFKQSHFSRWIHGDLNQRFVELATCKVVFVVSECDNLRINQSQVPVYGHLDSLGPNE